MCCTFAVTYYYYSSEYHDGCHHFLPCKDIHSDADAYHYGYDRLYVAVHAHKSRPDPFLPHRNEKVAYECGAYYQVGEFRKLDVLKLQESH